jgi:branched-chain amino acid transport system substrate-binding protein
LDRLLPLTGELAHIGKDDESGVRLAIKNLNTQHIRTGGQVATFVPDSRDDTADPRTAVTIAQKLVDDRVSGVAGYANSGTSIPASKISPDAGIP